MINYILRLLIAELLLIFMFKMILFFIVYLILNINGIYFALSI